MCSSGARSAQAPTDKNRINMKIPFSPPYIDQSVIDEVVDSLRSGWITTGPKVKALEESMRTFTGSQAVLCVNSWTSGAIMVLRWLGLKPGDEVIIPTYTYSATALAVLHAGGCPVMVDVGEDFNLTAEAVKNAVTPRTKAIIPVDFAGWPCDYDRIISLVDEPSVRALFSPDSPVQEKLGRVLVMSDAAHSLGARYKGRPVGTQADITVFSLHAVKNITTAEGGAISLNLPAPFDNEEVYGRMRLMSLNCQTKDAYTKTQGGQWRYDITGLGMKINMADVNAAIGLAQMRRYGQLLARRKEIFGRYAEGFGGDTDFILPPGLSADRESSYHIFPLRIAGIAEGQRDEIIREISAQEIGVNVHFIPLPMLSYFKGLGYDIMDYPAAYRNFSSEISLPVYPQLTDEQVDQVVSAVRAAVKKVKR